MRLDLGLLQMELTGRPDGATPHGFDSLLEYYESQLKEHKRNNGTELGFHLTSNECQSLREEAVMYYHRYLSLFVLEEFPGVVRDTARNLKVLDLCGKYAINQEDRLVLEQYRPYIVMMNIRAKASLLANEKRWKQALEIVNEGLESIKEFFASFGQEEAFARSNEVKILKKFARTSEKSCRSIRLRSSSRSSTRPSSGSNTKTPRGCGMRFARRLKGLSKAIEPRSHEVHEAVPAGLRIHASQRFSTDI